MSEGYKSLILTDIEQLRVKSYDTSEKIVEQIGLVDKIKEALKTSWTEGCGLAAIQIGYPMRAAWYTFERKDTLLINPRILAKDELCLISDEGCLSLPNQRLHTKRYRSIKYSNNGQIHDVFGMEAIIIQHEIDHMDGKLIIDRKYEEPPKQGRNELCKCGSGKKFKKCCGGF